MDQVSPSRDLRVKSAIFYPYLLLLVKLPVCGRGRTACHTVTLEKMVGLFILLRICGEIILLSFVCSKARTLFEKNAAPILHLSGMDVTVVKVRWLGIVDCLSCHFLKRTLFSSEQKSLLKTEK